MFSINKIFELESYAFIFELIRQFDVHRGIYCHARAMHFGTYQRFALFLNMNYSTYDKDRKFTFFILQKKHEFMAFFIIWLYISKLLSVAAHSSAHLAFFRAHFYKKKALTSEIVSFQYFSDTTYIYAKSELKSEEKINWKV